MKEDEEIESHCSIVPASAANHTAFAVALGCDGTVNWVALMFLSSQKFGRTTIAGHDDRDAVKKTGYFRCWINSAALGLEAR